MQIARTLVTLLAGLALAAILFQAMLYYVRHRWRRTACAGDNHGSMAGRTVSRLSAFGAECVAFCVAIAASPWRRAPPCAQSPARSLRGRSSGTPTGRSIPADFVAPPRNTPGIPASVTPCQRGVSTAGRTEPSAAQTPGRRPVVLVHGYALSGASFGLMARRLRQDGWTWVWPINHVPAFGNIDRNVDTLAAAVDEVRRLSGADRVDIVAHSMGGLVARAFIRNRGPAAVHRVITLGTPHCGTVYGNLVGWADPMVGQMQMDSAFLDALSQDDPVPEVTRVVSIYSLFDAVVVPPQNAYYPGACNIEIDGVGHNALLLSRRVYDLVRENLAADDTDATNDFNKDSAEV